MYINGKIYELIANDYIADFCAIVRNVDVQKCIECTQGTKMYKISKIHVIIFIDWNKSLSRSYFCNDFHKNMNFHRYPHSTR